jgi:hypothetical protein
MVISESPREDFGGSTLCSGKIETEMMPAALREGFHFLPATNQPTNLTML